jgi:hypothetical protein
MAKPLLIPKKATTTKPFAVRIPLALHQRLEAARKRADSKGFATDPSAVIAEALERYSAQLERELTASVHAPLPIARAQPNSL